MDIKTRRKKQQELMMQMVERKVRSRAQQIYDERGPGDGHALEDWVKAESEVLGNSILAPLYHRLKGENHEAPETAGTSDLPSHNCSACEDRA